MILLSNTVVIIAVCFAIAIHGFWIPAIPAGMTCFEILVYKDERAAWECRQGALRRESRATRLRTGSLFMP